MALWQYTFYVLPKESIQKLSPDLHFVTDNDGFDDAPFWLDQQIDKSFFSAIAKILPKGISWSNNIDLYGDQESNCVEVLSKVNLVVSVSLRIDFTSNYQNILIQLIEFFIFNGLVIIDEELNLLPNNLLTIEEKINTSLQYKKYKKLSNI
jgi:hypothetical protein